MCDFLVTEGKRIIRDAIRKKNKGHPEYAGNDSMNQLDAYGLIVYYKGRSQRALYGAGTMETGDLTHSSTGDLFSEEPHKGWKSAGIPDATGYEWAKMFAKDFSKTGQVPKDGFALVVFNAAFYSGILERGEGGIRHSYKVLSQIAGDMHDLQSKFKDSKLSGIGITI